MSDKIDLAAVLLEGGQPPYPEVDKGAFRESIFAARLPLHESTVFGFVGFPESRFDRRGMQLSSEALGYAGPSARTATYQRLTLDPATHICLQYDFKDGRDLAGTHRALPKPHGLSGAPIIRLFDLAGSSTQNSFALVGVVTDFMPKEKVAFGPVPI